MRDWYRQIPIAPTQSNMRLVDWPDIFTHWAALECDLREFQHVDVESGILHDRTWRWLRNQIWSIVGDSRTRLNKALSTSLGGNQ